MENSPETVIFIIMEGPNKNIIPGLEQRLKEPYYTDEGKRVFTERHNLDKGRCCGSTCRHCPYWPKYQRGNSRVRDGILKMIQAIQDRL